MAATRVNTLATVQQLLRGVGARGVEQSILNDCASHIGRNEGFGDQTFNGGHHVTVVARHGMRRLQREGSCEDREAAEHRALLIPQETMTPVECRSQAAVASQSAALVETEQSQLVVEKR